MYTKASCLPYVYASLKPLEPTKDIDGDPWSPSHIDYGSGATRHTPTSKDDYLFLDPEHVGLPRAQVQFVISTNVRRLLYEETRDVIARTTATFRGDIA